MKYSAIAILIVFMMVVMPVGAVEINPPVQGTSFWCKNDLTKWLCPKPGAQGPQGVQGIENMTANMTAGPTGPQGPAGEAGAPGGDSGLILYFNNTASDITGYESVRNIPSSANEIDESVIINASHSPVRVDSYAAAPLAITNTTRIPAGLWEFHLYSYLSSVVGTSYINVSVFNRTASGTETMLFTTRTQVAATVPTAYIIDYVQENDYIIASTDRLVFKIYGETTTVPDRTFHFVYQGSQHTSHIHTPLIPASGSASSLVAAAGQSIPVILGDNLGATNISIRNYSGGQVASIDSFGRIYGSDITGNLILVGNSSNAGKVLINPYTGSYTENTSNGRYGYVGIGTSTPGYQLELKNSNPADNSSSAVRIGNGITTSTWFVTGMNHTSQIGLFDMDTLYAGNESNIATVWSNGRAFYLGTYLGNAPLKFATNNQVRETIDGNGFVGIGCTTPQFKATVFGGTDVGIMVAQDGSFKSIINSTGTWVHYRVPGSNGGLSIISRTTDDTYGATGGFIDFYPRSSVKVRIAGDGKFGVGTTAPTTTEDINGDLRVRNCSGTPYFNASGYLFCISDETKKKNIQTYSGGLSKALGVTPITWTAGYSASEKMLGFSAQNVQQSIPEAVIVREVTVDAPDTSKAKDENGIYPTKEVKTGERILSIDQTAIIATELNAIKELSAKLDAQQATIDAQQKQIDELKARLDKAGIKP